MRSTLRLATALVALGLLAPVVSRAGDDVYTAERFGAHVAVLADDAMEGRATGSPGGRRAADYIAGRFQALGLEPAGDDGTFFQDFRLPDGAAARNVLARWPGRGANAGQSVLVGAHYDHLGLRPDQPVDDGDTLCNGADDNASGVAALLLIAEDLARSGDAGDDPPTGRRAIILAAFDAEEHGLAGSRDFAARSSGAVGKIVAVVNFDMIGRLRRGKLYAGDAPSSPAFLDELKGLEKELGLPIETRFGGVARSDQATFLERGIPGVHFNTGLYPEYHTPADELETLDLPGGAAIARVGGRLAIALAARPEAPRFQPLDPRYDVQHAIELVRGLGVVPNLGAQDGRRVQVLLVVPGSPAARHGIRAGDQLAAVNGLEIERVEDAVALVPQLRLEQGVRVTVLSKGERRDVTLPPEVFTPLTGPSVRHLEDGRYELTFHYVPEAADPKPGTVAVAGSFNNWDPAALPMNGPDDQGNFTARLVVPRGTYQYRFVLDGHDWRSDAANLHQTGPERNSVVWAGTGL